MVACAGAWKLPLCSDGDAPSDGPWAWWASALLCPAKEAAHRRDADYPPRRPCSPGVSWCEEKFERRKKRDRGKKEKKKRSKGSTDDAPANFLLFRMHCIANFVRMHCRPARRSNGNRRDPTQPTTADGAYVSDLREVELLLPPLSRSHRSRTGEPHPGRESPRPMYYGWWFLAQTMVDGWRGRIAIP